ncbi:hypothetical protein HMI56_005947 [Coelomomyces lativittatus]|nr:hypothetical protein HMI56_005947 [Coelomomyces lativittatus]
MDLTTSLQTSLSTTTTLTTLTLPSSLITLLEELTSQHPDIVKSAEKKLRLDEVLPGFHAALQVHLNR